MEPARIVEQVFFPLAEELALLPGSLTPRQQEHLAHLATWMPFARAAQMLDRLLGVQVSEPTVRRGTLRAAALYEARHTAQSQKTSPAELTTVSAEHQVISLDGAYVPLVGGVWAQVRTLAIGEVAEERTIQEQCEVHACQLSYFSRMTDAETFGDVAQVEMQRRVVSQAKAVCAVTDGADWMQGFLDLHRPDAVRMLDFPHAAEHVHLLIEALPQAGVSLPVRALERRWPVLKHRGPGLLLRWCARLPPAVQALEAVQHQLSYFRKRVSLLQYPQYQHEGWPIGSGMEDQRQHAGGTSPSQRRRHALGTNARSPPVSPADRRL